MFKLWLLFVIWKVSLQGDLGNEESGDELNEEDGEGDEPSGKEEDSAWREERRNMPKHGRMRRW